MDVASWEADLQRRAAFCRKEKNWPACFPIIHHDISKEIPVRHRRMQYLAFASWLGIVLCLVWNVIAVTASCIKWGDTENFFLAVIYALLGCPLSYVLWYRPLYNTVSFCCFATIAPPIISKGNSLAGIFTAIDVFFSDGVIVGASQTIKHNFQFNLLVKAQLSDHYFISFNLDFLLRWLCVVLS